MPVRTLLAVPLTSAHPPLDEQVRAAQAAGADLVELRVDCIGDVAAVEALLAQPRLLPLIVTVRSAEEGGAWLGNEAERVALIEHLGQRFPGYIDVEYATWQRWPSVRQKIGLVCDASRAEGTPPRNRLILSQHNLQYTPANPEVVFDRLLAAPADVVKVVFTARDATDAFRVLAELQRRSARRDVIALAMGEAGLATRVLARKFGGFLTFGALHAGGASAPGQPTVTELSGLYHWDRVGPATRVYGVVGWPVLHSQSPAIHNAAMAATGVDGVYVPLPVRPRFRDFAAFMACLTRTPQLDVVGLSVTSPHKEHAVRWLTRRGFAITPSARRCGAVNTLTRLPDGTWEGDNTDGPGALAALQSAARCAGNRLHGLSVDVLGAGGVARAVVSALLEYDCAITVFGRTAARAERLAQELRCAWKPWEERRHCAGDVLINCTPVGLWPATEESPLPDDALRSSTLVFDTVYHPVQTRLLRRARSRGCEIVSGVPMFIGQAAAQFERWHGLRAPAEVMAGAFRAEADWQL